MREDRDTNVARLEAKVVELRKEEALAQKKIIEEFKALDDFQEAIELTASRYFGKGFDFCKWQIRCHNPDLNINI